MIEKYKIDKLVRSLRYAVSCDVLYKNIHSDPLYSASGIILLLLEKVKILEILINLIFTYMKNALWSDLSH